MALSRAPIPPGGMRGFTLIELMVTLTVLAIVLSLAAPSFASLLASNRMATQTNELIGALNLARSEAVRRSQPVTLLAANANYSKGWKVFPDANGNGAAASATDPADGLPIRENSAFGGTVTLKRQTCTGSPCTYADSTEADITYLVFNERGGISAISTPAYFKVCDPSRTSIKGRLLQVNLVGKISLVSTDLACT